MELVTRENAIIAGSIVLAIVAWYAVQEFTDLGTAVALAVLIGVGILLPTILLNYVRS